ncbi:MAG TPA: serine hydrolase domain-containing protein [Gemmatimonadales bacterium]|nr:serine hydrolase domain-containing protein [Gemmatimonadales bacterium]
MIALLALVVMQGIDTLFAGYTGAAVPGASVVVIRDGRVVLRRAYGSANLETREPATPATNYRLASLTKQFTAMAVMLLERDGKLRYDQPVREILPELPPAARSVTIRQLLNHSSGLWDYEDLIPDTQTVQLSDRDVLVLLSRKDTLYFAPGSTFRYSNSGYVLLGLVVERVSGIPFARFLHERIFAPLGMTATVAHVEGVDTVPRRAYGYTGSTPSDQSVTSATLGDGGIYSNVDDLVRWDQALYGSVLVDTAALGRVITPPYGFGWFVDTYCGARRWRHHGETSGFRNEIQRFPDRRFTVIVLTNRNGGEPRAIAERIADRLLCAPSGTPRPGG